MQPEGSQLKMKIACQINGNEGFQLQTAANSKETNTSKYIKTVEMKQGTCFERYLVILVSLRLHIPCFLEASIAWGGPYKMKKWFMPVSRWNMMCILDRCRWTAGWKQQCQSAICICSRSWSFYQVTGFAHLCFQWNARYVHLMNSNQFVIV